MLVVRVGLQRPSRSSCSHCAIFGVLAALSTPTEIFPILTIPVLSMVTRSLSMRGNQHALIRVSPAWR
jgi:hypothetical protein